MWMSVHAGWKPIVTRLLERVQHELTPEERARVHFENVKQKCGVLTVYAVIDPPDRGVRERLDAIVAASVAEADATCEYCGAPGALWERKDGWLHVACPEHRERMPREELK